MKLNLVLPEKLTAEEILEKVESGSRFKLFRYNISLLFMSFERFSPAILVSSGDNFKHNVIKYNILNILLGLFYIPEGPYLVYKNIKLNMAGGLDITDDIVLNINTYQMEEGTMVIEKTNKLFDNLPKDEIKELNKALKGVKDQFPEIKKIYCARYLNVEEYTDPPYFIMIETQSDLAHFEEAILKKVYKYFNEFAYFEIITSNDNPEMYDLIVKQGREIV